MIRSRTYRFGLSHLTLTFGDLVTSDAQVLVSSDDHFISMSGGVSGAIRRAGGTTIALDAAKKVPTTLGSVVMTTAGSLPAQYIFHAITIGPNPDGLADEAVIGQTTRRCMQLLKELQLRSIAFPAIGAGVAGFSYEDVAARMADVIAGELSDHGEAISVTIYLLDRFGEMKEIDFVNFFEEFSSRSPGVSRRMTPAVEQPAALSPSVHELASATEEELLRIRINKLRRFLGELEEARSRIEDQLLTALRAGDASAIETVRSALSQNEEIRFMYRSELRDIGDAGKTQSAPQPSTPLTVFVSSTSRDLQAHRLAVKDAVIKRKFFFRGMEIFGADRLKPAAMIVKEVRQADVYIGIFGVRYGSIDSESGLSMTELEFREAEASERKILLYVMHPDAPVSAGHMESDPESARKLAELKEYLMQKYVVYPFKTVDELAGQVYIDLGK